MTEKQVVVAPQGMQVPPLLMRKVEDFDMPRNVANALRDNHITYLGDLVQKTESEVLRMKYIGRKTFNEIKAVLAELDLHLGMEVPGWPTPLNLPAKKRPRPRLRPEPSVEATPQEMFVEALHDAVSMAIEARIGKEQFLKDAEELYDIL